MTIYLDLIFIENIFMNIIIIYASAIILKKKIIITRFLLGSIVGAVYSCIYYTLNFEVLSSVILKIVLSITIIYISFNSKTIKDFFKELLIFYLTSFTFGGVTFALLYFINPNSISIQNGVLVGTYPLIIILIGGLIGFIIIIFSFRTIKNKIAKRDTFCVIQIEFENKRVKINSIIDTGNFLKEPITGCPVVIVEKEILKKIIPEDLLNDLQNIINGRINTQKKYLSKIKIIPFKALGTDNGLLLGIKPDKFTIYYQGKFFSNNDVIIGIYDKRLSKNNSYNALVGIDIVEKM